MARTRYLALAGIAIAALTVGCNTLNSQESADYPSRDITLINPYAPGGTTDPVSRQFADMLGEELDSKVIVQNREGGGSTVGTGEVISADPDGYTIGLASTSGYTVAPLLQADELPYQGVDDFQPIVQPYEQYPVLVAQPDAPYQNLKEFVQFAKNNPGSTMGSPGRFTATELGGLAFAEVAGIDVTPTPFTGGSGDALTALQGGKVDTVVAGPGGSLAGLERAGKVRVLGSLGPYRVEAFPQAQSAKEAGYGEGLLSTSFSILAPNDLPNDVSDQLIEAGQKIVEGDEYQQWAKKNGYDVPKNVLSGDELSTSLEEERAGYEKLLTDLGEL